MNRGTIIGNLTRDVELKALNSGTSVASFAIAVNERFKQNGQQQEYVNFFDVSCYGKTAEVCAKYLSKGSKVGIEYKLHQSRWEKEGQKRNKVELIADKIDFLSLNKKEADDGIEDPWKE